LYSENFANVFVWKIKRTACSKDLPQNRVVKQIDPSE